MAQADYQRATATRCNQAVWLFDADQRQAICAVQAFDRYLEGVGQIWRALEGVVNQVDDHFGVGLRNKRVAQRFELFTQGFVVFDDAVVHHCHFVAGEMRVSIGLGRCTVGSPAGVGDAQLARQRLGGNSGFQFADLADPATTLKGTVLGIDGQPCAVIATVFQALEAFDQDGSNVALGYGTDDSTHN